MLPHAVPELIALFLPLAAWIIASRRGEWEQLLAATVVTVAMAVPVLVVAALVEVYVSPHLFTALTDIHPPIVRSEGWIVRSLTAAAKPSWYSRRCRLAPPSFALASRSRRLTAVSTNTACAIEIAT